ncbi:unnamed protein product [Adineta ricciae]|uniref:Cytochrome P450 n=1 Tax=Adineta ricciae TaxID=249248 RepID=A0A815JUF5_ADIRI|nr:unnamed protein product [Adineta ricciae]
MLLIIFLYCSVGLISLIFFLIYWKLVRPQKYYYDTFRNQKIPCEPFVPLIGQIPEIRCASENDATMDYRLKLIEKHGNVFVTGFGPSIKLNVNEPDMLADIFGRSHAQDYGKPNLTEKFFQPLIGVHNLLISQGEEHERARKMLNPAFHFVKLQGMISIMIEQTRKAIDELLISKTNEKSIDLQVELNALTLNIITSSAFGQSFDSITDAKQNLCQTFIELSEAIIYRTLRGVNLIPIVSQLPFWYKNMVEKNSKKLANFVDQIISDRRSDRSKSLSSNEDILDLLLSAVDTQGKSFTNEEIKDQALTFVLAGHETTGNLMTWCMFILMTNENVFKACQNEIDRIFPNGIEPTYEHLNELVVCEAVLYETLRLYPPASFIARKCLREHYIGSENHRQIYIPKGAEILVNTYALHRRKEFWSNPDEFDYTRWIRDPLTGRKPKLTHPFCYLPFAAGPRNCIGQNFALLEAKVILAMFVQRCHFELEPGQKIVPDLRITIHAKYGLRAKVTKRL